jgi:hypothetical protein
MLNVKDVKNYERITIYKSKKLNVLPYERKETFCQIELS